MKKNLVVGLRSLSKIEKEYIEKGYKVVSQPSGDQLPNELKGYTPDLIAKKGKETIVVEVKSLKSLKGNSEMLDLVRKVCEQKGWQFNLVISNPSKKSVESSKAQMNSLGPIEIASQIDEIEKLISSNMVRSAVLLFGAVAEGIFRLMLSAKMNPGSRVGLKPYLQEAVFQGILSKEDFDLFESLLLSRNGIAHAYDIELPSGTELSAALRILKKMLESL